MVILENYYENVDVEILEDSTLSRRVKTQFDQVVLRLPDEEPYEIGGIVYVGRNNELARILLEIDSEHHTHPVPVVVRDGNIIIDIREDPEETHFILTLNLDRLEGKSDMEIQGFIISKLSEITVNFKLLCGDLQKYKKMGRKAREITVHKNTQKILDLDHEQRRQMVDAEAQRLGFSRELRAYDVPDAAPSS